ncbi:dITP/XTP pyrophosphatase [Apilactobacillus kunkeei]|uniref:XTP/dITP diphosphatase n=1 Tax=Apilactobacillus kunkeei TaxID=148814 RepID=UPI00200AA1B6|nr:XTP/dITP diphosphatase [Apilactobacillus kunkeei]MCK8634204.1 XTP/dITP diphosphatase [Apilactobacillus kunkeei]CAI2585466.1 dITP/XTP pyrophosphatase [Apilactobacillus kunkeei]CAI2585796.1 dITP/XTP pyrophosphatase [Apilactobacillus kunkeei]CAI2586264.1 dITP/XTP pyrophosphatase [Apilactobacillus kunkeei]CAI2586332.1 dITP/XTP pyrophosphatase [Apilactobacillus kunkeei]
MDKIVIATNNQNKAREFREMFADKNIDFKTLADFPELGKIIENGESFEENATIKAQAIFERTNLAVLADDSGLEVPALNNEPGIHSARYAGDHDDDANNKKLLVKLGDSDKRDAKFVTCLVLLNQHGEKFVVYGTVEGTILKAPRGDNGFGYDPLFYVPSKKKTMAEMSDYEKNEISHRGNAIKQLYSKFDEWWRA